VVEGQRFVSSLIACRRLSVAAAARPRGARVTSLKAKISEMPLFEPL
jgi:hypothetical protein